jgi:GGDEF domain-containing protein
VPPVPPVRWSVADEAAERLVPVPPADLAEDEPGADGEGAAPAGSGTPGLFAQALEEKDPVTGLPGLGNFFSRTGRLLGPEQSGSQALSMVVIEVKGFPRPEELVAQLVACTLQSHLRGGDPVARVGRAVFAAAVTLDPGSTLAPAIEQRLAGAVRSALNHGTATAVVESAHVFTGATGSIEADELLRRALRLLGDA